MSGIKCSANERVDEISKDLARQLGASLVIATPMADETLDHEFGEVNALFDQTGL